LIAFLGAFLRVSEASMSARAVSTVPVDWQIELVPGMRAARVDAALDAVARVGRRQWVGYAAVDGFEATTGETVQTTGAGKVVGIGSSYIGTFPQQIRILHGMPDGALLAQQTAANLHVGVGDTVTVHRPDMPDMSVTVAGVIDLPNADAMFQAVAAPPGA